jgi:hypothetical protein
MKKKSILKKIVEFLKLLRQFFETLYYAVTGKIPLS